MGKLAVKWLIPCFVTFSKGKAGNYCYGTCNHQGRCTSSLQSSYGYYPGYPAPSPQPYPAPAYSVYHPGNVQTVTSTMDPYPSTCPATCSQHSTLDCYMQCNDECCESRHGKRKWKSKAMSAMMKEKFGKLNQDLIEEETKETRNKSDDLDDKAKDSQHNTTETDNVEDEKIVIANLKKRIKSLQSRLKKKNQAKQHNRLDNLTNDSIESNDVYYRNTSHKTELSSYDENRNDLYRQERNKSTTNAHDLIDDEPEPSTSDDEEVLYNETKNVTSTSVNGSEYNQEYSIALTNNVKEPGFRNGSLINEENTVKTTPQPSVQVTNELYDEKEKSIKNTSSDTDELGDKNAEEDDMKETKTADSESEPPSERGLYSLQDSAIDPTEELLDEEEIDDVGKFGRKRNMIFKKKKSG